MTNQTETEFSVSVCLASFNGMLFIEAQLTSILKQLNAQDEVIVSDDHSSDGTWEFLQQLSQKDSRIKIYKNPQKGLIKNFENAIFHSQNDIIFLSDQDDLWQMTKIATTLEYFKRFPQKSVVVSDLTIVDNQLEVLVESYQKMRHTKSGFWSNLLRSSYIGAAMAFRKELKSLILPIPANVPMHDMWIGLLADKSQGVLFISESLVLYRRHDFNASEIKTTASKKQQLKWRWDVFQLIRQRVKEFKKIP